MSVNVCATVKGWLLEYSYAHRLTASIQALHSDIEDAQMAGMAESLHFLTCTLHTILLNNDQAHLDIALQIANCLFENLPEAVPFKLFAKITTGIKVLKLFEMLRRKDKMVLFRLNQFFPRSGFTHKRADARLEQKLTFAQQKFRKFFLVLLANETEREKYLESELEGEFGSEFCMKLQQLEEEYSQAFQQLAPKTVIEELLEQGTDSKLASQLAEWGGVIVEMVLDCIHGKSCLSENDVLDMWRLLHPRKDLPATTPSHTVRSPPALLDVIDSSSDDSETQKPTIEKPTSDTQKQTCHPQKSEEICNIQKPTQTNPAQNSICHFQKSTGKTQNQKPTQLTCQSQKSTNNTQNQRVVTEKPTSNSKKPASYTQKPVTQNQKSTIEKSTCQPQKTASHTEKHTSQPIKPVKHGLKQAANSQKQITQSKVNAQDTYKKDINYGIGAKEKENSYPQMKLISQPLRPNVDCEDVTSSVQMDKITSLTNKDETLPSKPENVKHDQDTSKEILNIEIEECKGKMRDKNELCESQSRTAVSESGKYVHKTVVTCEERRKTNAVDSFRDNTEGASDADVTQKGRRNEHNEGEINIESSSCHPDIITISSNSENSEKTASDESVIKISSSEESGSSHSLASVSLLTSRYRLESDNVLNIGQDVLSIVPLHVASKRSAGQAGLDHARGTDTLCSPTEPKFAHIDDVPTVETSNHSERDAAKVPQDRTKQMVPAAFCDASESQNNMLPDASHVSPNAQPHVASVGTDQKLTDQEVIANAKTTISEETPDQVNHVSSSGSTTDSPPIPLNWENTDSKSVAEVRAFTSAELTTKDIQDTKEETKHERQTYQSPQDSFMSVSDSPAQRSLSEKLSNIMDKLSERSATVRKSFSSVTSSPQMFTSLPGSPGMCDVQNFKSMHNSPKSPIVCSPFSVASSMNSFHTCPSPDDSDEDERATERPTHGCVGDGHIMEGNTMIEDSDIDPSDDLFDTEPMSPDVFPTCRPQAMEYEVPMADDVMRSLPSLQSYMKHPDLKPCVIKLYKMDTVKLDDKEIFD